MSEIDELDTCHRSLLRCEHESAVIVEAVHVRGIEVKRALLAQCEVVDSREARHE